MPERAMTAADLMLAVLLLSAPHGVKEVPPMPERWPGLRDALHQTAVDWEILDPREKRNVLVKLEDFQEDLDFLRKRRAELAEAPHLTDCHRMPDRRTINECIQFNRSFRKNMEARLLWESDRAGLIREIIEENERLYKVWDAIRDARSDLHYITTRRHALQRLRDLIGPDAYDSTESPPYVPDWRFARHR
jgi:hypothetical protein